MSVFSSVIIAVHFLSRDISKQSFYFFRGELAADYDSLGKEFVDFQDGYRNGRRLCDQAQWEFFRQEIFVPSHKFHTFSA